MWSTLVPIIGGLLDKIIPDKTKADEAKLKLMELQISGQLDEISKQQSINEKESESSSIFISGWRPAIGWILAASIAYQYLLRPLLIGFNISTTLPGLDEMLWELMFGMVGVSGLHTFEKVNMSR